MVVSALCTEQLGEVAVLLTLRHPTGQQAASQEVTLHLVEERQVALEIILDQMVCKPQTVQDKVVVVVDK